MLPGRFRDNLCLEEFGAQKGTFCIRRFVYIWKLTTKGVQISPFGLIFGATGTARRAGSICDGFAVDFRLPGALLPSSGISSGTCFRDASGTTYVSRNSLVKFVRCFEGVRYFFLLLLFPYSRGFDLPSHGEFFSEAGFEAWHNRSELACFFTNTKRPFALTLVCIEQSYSRCSR